MEITEMKVKLTLTEEMLGTASSNPEIHRDFIASKGPDAKSVEEEVAALGVDEVVDKGKTIFPKMDDGTPFYWDYQLKGFMKDVCGMLKKVTGTKSAGVKAYKKEIDGLFFVKERKIPIHLSGPMGDCQRPLRAQTAQGERVALANSETVPAGSWIEFTVQVFRKSDIGLVREWLDYGAFRGLGQWRNASKGRFTWEEVKA